MTMLRRLAARLAVSALAVGLVGGPAAAQTDWPRRPVRVVVPFAAGSGTDFIVRAIAERLSRQLGQQFVVEHRGGAAGALGTEGVVRSPADGYTVLMTPQAPVVVIPNLRKLPYDPLKDLVGVSRMGEVIAGFAVYSGLGVNNIQEFVALAKKKPGEITFVSAGVGSVTRSPRSLGGVARSTGSSVDRVPPSIGLPVTQAPRAGLVGDVTRPLADGTRRHPFG